MKLPRFALLFALSIALANIGAAQSQTIDVEAQPLADNALRVLKGLDALGQPFSEEQYAALAAAANKQDVKKIQELLEPHVLLHVHLNPEARVKVKQGLAPAQLQQGGYTPVLIKVINHATSTARLRVTSRQAGPPYAGVAKGTMERERQQHLRENENARGEDRFLEIEMFGAPPMTANLSGLEVEYVIALIYSSEAGHREATLAFDIGQGTQDLGFRAEGPVLFNVRLARNDFSD